MEVLLPSISTSALHDGDIFVFSASFLSSFFFVRYVSKNPIPTSLVITIASLLSLYYASATAVTDAILLQ